MGAWIQQIGEPPATPKRRLVCFPHAGGNVRSFREWPTCLPDGWDLWVAELPGHGARLGEPLEREVGAVLPHLVAAVVPLLDRPTIFFGHSLGAILAFELARALADHPRRPDLVVLSARSCPEVAQESLHLLDDAAFIERVSRIAGLDHAAPELIELVLPALRADFEMGERWRPADEPLDIPILAFAGLSDPDAPPASMDGWAHRTRAGFRRYAFPGDHFFPDRTLGTLLRFIDEAVVEWAA